MRAGRPLMSALAALALLSGVLAGQGQEGPKVPGVTAEVEVEVLSLDVLVLDRKERPVLDVKPSEVVVKVGGVVQQLEYFEPPEQVTRPSGEGAVTVAGTTQAFGPSLPYRPLRILFFVDLEDLPFAAITDLSRALASQVESLPGSPRVTLVAYYGHGSTLVSDEVSIDRIREAAETLPGLVAEEGSHATATSSRGSSGPVVAARSYERRRRYEDDLVKTSDPRAINHYLGTERARVLELVQELDVFASRLLERDGRRHFVLVSRGIERTPGLNFITYWRRFRATRGSGLPPLDSTPANPLESSTMVAELHELGDLERKLAASGLTLHFLDPSNTLDFPGAAADAVAVARDLRRERTSMQDPVLRLVTATGGLSRLSSGDLGSGILALVSSGSARYRIGVRLAGLRKDQRYRVDVEVKRSGLHVLQQSAFQQAPAPERAPERAAARQGAEAIHAAAEVRRDERSPRAVRLVRPPIGVKIRFIGKVRADEKAPGRNLYRVEVAVATADVRFVPQENELMASYRIAVEAKGTGTTSATASFTVEMTPSFTGAEYSEALATDQMRSVLLSLPPGTYELHASVSDLIEEGFGSARVDITAPE